LRHSARTLAEVIGISAKGIEKQLAKLKASGKIARVGSAKGGYWHVNTND
jgi:predicted HTH transcriptional regulator